MRPDEKVRDVVCCSLFYVAMFDPADGGGKLVISCRVWRTGNQK
jgi:hypothetical protein